MYAREMLVAALATMVAGCGDCVPPQPLESSRWDGFCDAVGLDDQHAEFHYGYLIGDDEATTFEWTAPGDATFVGDATKPFVTVRFGSQDGEMCVTAVNSCGQSNQLCRPVTVVKHGIWTVMHGFAGGRISRGTAVVSGGRAFVGLGEGFTGITNGWYEYDAPNDAWIPRTSAPFIGSEVSLGAAAIANKVYVLTNRSGWYEYDVTADRWTARAVFPGGVRVNAAVFGTAGMVYAGLGYVGPTTLTDLHRYDPGSDQWVQMASPGGSIQPAHAVAPTGDDTGLVWLGGAWLRYDAGPGTWARLQTSAIATPGAVVRVGGNAYATDSNQIEQLDLGTLQTSMLPVTSGLCFDSINVGSNPTAGIPSDGRIFLVGGSGLDVVARFTF